MDERNGQGELSNPASVKQESLVEEGEIRDSPESPPPEKPQKIKPNAQNPKSVFLSKSQKRKRNKVKRKQESSFAVKCFEANFQKNVDDIIQPEPMLQQNFDKNILPKVIENLQTLKQVLGQVKTNHHDQYSRQDWSNHPDDIHMDSYSSFDPRLPKHNVNSYQNSIPSLLSENISFPNGSPNWDDQADNRDLYFSGVPLDRFADNRDPFHNAPAHWDVHLDERNSLLYHPQTTNDIWAQEVALSSKGVQGAPFPSKGVLGTPFPSKGVQGSPFPSKAVQDSSKKVHVSPNPPKKEKNSAATNDPSKRAGNFKATLKIPLDDPYWKPCFSDLPRKELFQPGIFYIDQFKNLKDGARVKIRTFNDGTVMVLRKGDYIVLSAPPDAPKVSPLRCDQCTKKSHSHLRCQMIQCHLCKKQGHVATKCMEPEIGDYCLSCKDTDHNHTERSRCARIVYVPMNLTPCAQCGSRNHKATACNQMKCNLCGEEGHIGNACTKSPKHNKIEECQDLSDGNLKDSNEAVLRCMLCVKIGQFTYAAELNDKNKYSQINSDSVKIKGFNGYSPSLRLPIKIGTLVHDVIFRVNKKLDTPVSLGKEALDLFNIRVFVGNEKVYTSCVMEVDEGKQEVYGQKDTFTIKQE